MKDCVKFFLHKRYFQLNTLKSGPPSKLCRQSCLEILSASFDLHISEGSAIMSANPDGFWIYCTFEQFALFIILRYEMNEVTNGIRDLQPHIVENPVIIEGPVGRTARELGMTHDRVSEVVRLHAKLLDQPRNYVDVRKKTYG